VIRKPPVLVLGNGITALGVMRACRRAGIPVYSLRPSIGIDKYSRWHRPAPMRPGTEGVLPMGLAEHLGCCELPTAVLMPCSDAFTNEAAALGGELRQRFPASLPSPEAIAALTDKAAFGRLLEEADVPHPVTRLIESAEELEALPESVRSSAFLKPHDSQHFFVRFGVKAFWVNSVAEAAERMRQVEEAGLKVLLQEYIPGPGSEHYLVDGFIDAAGRCRGVFARRRLRMYPADFGNSSYMISVPQEEMAQAIASIRAILERLNFRGIFSAEFKRDPRDGLFKILEVNARPWWYIEFAARSGVDVCTMAYRDALGLPVAEVTGQRVGARLVYPYYDYFACRNAVRAGKLTRREWLRSWIGAQQPLFNWSDPLPALAESWNVGIGWIRNRLGRGAR
jgi:D-aspartate ligase